MQKLKLGEFEYDVRLGTLISDGQSHRLEPMLQGLLECLLEHKGQTVSRDMLLESVWAGRHVSDDALRATIKKLREALGDDARNPRYVKTLPMRGYQLIAEVEEIKAPNTAAKNWPIVAPAAAMALLAMVWWLWPTPTSHIISQTADVSPLTRMAGSELLPDFHEPSNRLVFSQRANHGDPLMLFVKDLTTQRLQRLSWDQASYEHPRWSPNGRRLAYNRKSKGQSHIYIANVDVNGGVGDVGAVGQNAAGKYVLNWSADGQSLYLKDHYSPGAAQGVSRYHIDTDTLTRITAPDVEGQGDVFAAESPQGDKLAILRAVNPNRHELLISDLATGALLTTQLLSSPYYRLHWHKGAQALWLSAFNGELAHFDLNSGVLTQETDITSTRNHLFHVCGQRCLFMREHNGNYLDIEEQPLPFSATQLMATLHMDMPGAEDFPIYGKNGDLYFLAQQNDQVLLKYQGQNQGPVTLTPLETTQNLHSLSVSPSGSHLLAMDHGRILLIDLSSLAQRYLTSGLEVVSNPSWSADGTAVIFTLLEQNEPHIYRLALANKQRELVAKGLLAYRESSRDVSLQLTPTYVLQRQRQNEPPLPLLTLKSPQGDLWKMRGQHLYVMERRGTEAWLLRIDIDTGAVEEVFLADQRFRLHFDVDSSEQKMLVVQSQLAASNLVKVQLAPISAR